MFGRDALEKRHFLFLEVFEARVLGMQFVA
jgi:hypothetical protein